MGPASDFGLGRRPFGSRTTLGLVTRRSQTLPIANERPGLFIAAGIRDGRFGFSERAHHAECQELVRRGVLHRWHQHHQGAAQPGPVKVRQVYAFNHQLPDGYFAAFDRLVAGRVGVDDRPYGRTSLDDPTEPSGS